MPEIVLVEEKYRWGDPWKILKIDGVTWMANDPQEVACMKFLSDQAHGDVLVAGLGFGLFSLGACENPNVTSVTTVELLPEIVDISEQFTPSLLSHPKHTLVQGDFYQYQTATKYDTVFGDIWTQFDDEAVWEAFVAHAAQYLKEGGLLYGWHDRFIPAHLKDGSLILKRK